MDADNLELSSSPPTDADLWARLQAGDAKALATIYRSLRRTGVRDRAASTDKLFDPVIYTNTFPDLRRAFGTDFVAATQHYIQTVFAEGRTTPCGSKCHVCSLFAF